MRIEGSGDGEGGGGGAAAPEVGEAAAGGFAVGALDVEAGAVHDVDDVVEADEVFAVGEEGEGGALEGAEAGGHVAFDAGDLDVAFDGVAGESEVMFHADFGGVFDLVEGSALELGAGGGGHGAGGSDFALAADFGSGDGGVGADDGSEEASGGKGAEDFFAGGSLDFFEVVEQAGEDAGGAAGGGGDDGASSGVFFGDGEGEGGKLGDVALGTLKVLAAEPGGVGAAGEFEGAGEEDVGAFKSGFDAGPHGVPDGVETGPGVGFDFGDEVPKGEVVFFAVGEDFGDAGEGIADGGDGADGAVGVFEGAAADAVDFPVEEEIAGGGVGAEEEGVGMAGGGGLGVPDDVMGKASEFVADGLVGEVAFAGFGEAAAEFDLDAIGRLGEAFAEDAGGALGADAVGAGGALADAVDVEDGADGSVHGFPLGGSLMGFRGETKPKGYRGFA